MRRTRPQVLIAIGDCDDASRRRCDHNIYLSSRCTDRNRACQLCAVAGHIRVRAFGPADSHRATDQVSAGDRQLIVAS